MAEEQKTQDAQAALNVVSTSPHAHSGASVQRIMLDVVIALMPALGAAIWFFGWDALRLTLACVVSCVAIEALCRKAMGRDLGIGDLSAVVTGILWARPPILFRSEVPVRWMMAPATRKRRPMVMASLRM